VFGSILAALNAPLFTALGTSVSSAEAVGFVTGALCVWLVARQHLANWPIGIANNVFFIVLFAGSGLYADAGLQVVYIALAGYGWWQWVYGAGRRVELPVTRTTRAEWWWLAGCGLAGTAGLWLLLSRLTDSTVPAGDALTTVLSLLATYGQSRKRWESWLFWIAADLVYIPLYAYKQLWLTALLYVLFLALCLFGLRGWLADLRRAGAVRSDPVPAPAAAGAAGGPPPTAGRPPATAGGPPATAGPERATGAVEAERS
jgi:nicotinamide mononucleotide transporter